MKISLFEIFTSAAKQVDAVGHKHSCVAVWEEVRARMGNHWLTDTVRTILTNEYAFLFRPRARDQEECWLAMTFDTAEEYKQWRVLALLFAAQIFKGKYVEIGE